MPACDATNPKVVKAWQEISAEYARGVSATVRAVIGQSLRLGKDSMKFWDYPHHLEPISSADAEQIIAEIQEDFAKGGHLLEIE